MTNESKYSLTRICCNCGCELGKHTYVPFGPISNGLYRKIACTCFVWLSNDVCECGHLYADHNSGIAGICSMCSSCGSFQNVDTLKHNVREPIFTPRLERW